MQYVPEKFSYHPVKKGEVEKSIKKRSGSPNSSQQWALGGKNKRNHINEKTRLDHQKQNRANHLIGMGGGRKG